MDSRTLLFDTNAAMHYEFLDTIDWPNILEVQRVPVVVHPELIRELNELKDAKDRAKKTRERAAKVIKHFGEIFSRGLITSGRRGVEIRIEPDEPKEEIFAANNLNHQFGDDCHLASVLKRQLDHADEHILLVTHDTGVQLKAQAKGISFVDPPAQHRLPEGPDSLEKRNQQLEQELASYKAQIPSIRLCADDGAGQINITKYDETGQISIVTKLEHDKR